MKVAMLHVDLPSESRGGVAHQVSRLSDVLAQRGHDVIVFTVSTPPEDVAYSVRRLPLRGPLARRPWNLLAVPIAFALGRYREFDIVHAHGDSQLLLRRRPPIVRTFYGSALDEAAAAARLRRRVAQRALYRAELVARRTATCTVGISHATEQSVGPLDAIIPCGVDTSRFHPGTKSVQPSILFIGTLGGRKRGQFLVDVFGREIRPRLPRCELWIVADQEVREDGVRCFSGASDELVARLFREAWLFALPSTYEGFGVPYIEAMASGTPPVATPNAGAVELLGTESGGTVASEGEFGAALLALLEDEGRRHELGSQGVAYSRRFDWSQIAVRYEQIYRQLLRTNGER